LQCLFVLSYGFVIATLEIVNPTVVGVDNQRQRIEFASALDMCQGLRISSNQCEGEPEAVMRGGITSIERERVFVFGNAFFPLPLEGVDLCHRPMSLSQRAIKLDSRAEPVHRGSLPRCISAAVARGLVTANARTGRSVRLAAFRGYN